MALPVILTGGQLTVNTSPLTTVDLICPAWTTHDAGFADLWRGPDIAGQNIPIPGAADYPVRRFPTTSIRQFPLFVVGECDRAGTPNANAITGLQANLDFLRANVFDPPPIADRPDGTRVLTLTMPSGATRTTSAHFRPFTISEATPSGWFLLCEVEIATGVVGS